MSKNTKYGVKKEKARRAKKKRHKKADAKEKKDNPLILAGLQKQ